MAELTDKQRAFIEHYLTCWNAAEAARRAGYAERSARQIGQENLSKPDIRAEIDARLKAHHMGADEVLMRLAFIARGDMTDFLTDGGAVMLDLRKAAKAGKLGLIKKFSRVKGDVVVELHDSVQALQLIGKHYGLFVDRTEHSGELTHKVYVPSNDFNPDDA